MSVVATERRDAVAVVRLDYPPVNAINSELLGDLDAALVAAAQDEGVRAIVITGNGKGFCGGGDTRNMGDTDPIAKHALMRQSAAVTELVTQLPLPVIGAVHGYAIGGGLSLAIACDITLAEASTVFRMGFIDVAITPDMGAHHFLAEALGVRRTKELIWSGGGFSAEEGVALGLLNQVVPDGTVVEAALERAAALAAGPRHAVAYTKQVLAAAHGDQLRQVLDAEAWASAMLRTTDDHHEAVAARREKRPPVFNR